MTPIEQKKLPVRVKGLLVKVLLGGLVVSGAFLAKDKILQATKGLDGDAFGKVSTVLRSELDVRDGQYFLPDSLTPFSGVMEEYYKGEKLKARQGVSDGRLHGLSEGWYTNGQMQVSEHYRKGIPHGLRTKWYPNGVKRSEDQIVKGKHHGVYKRWHENGALAHYAEFDEDQPHGLSRAYFPSGFWKAEVKARKGEILKRKTWSDGEFRGALAQVGELF